MARLPDGQTCLENVGITHRPILLNKNEYSKTEIYDVNHPNALATGDARGKGTAHGGHTHSIPDCKTAQYIGEHFQSDILQQIDTFPDSGPNSTGGGDCIDVGGLKGVSPTGRNRLLGINMFNYETQYDSNYVNTSKNVEDGQFVVGYVQSDFKCERSNGSVS